MNIKAVFYISFSAGYSSSDMSDVQYTDLFRNVYSIKTLYQWMYMFCFHVNGKCCVNKRSVQFQ